MWISRRKYATLLAQVSAAHAERDVARAACERHDRDAARLLGENLTMQRAEATQHTLQSWLCARVNQLEQTVSILLREITKLEIPAPQLSATAPSLKDRTDALLAAPGVFDDMGDEEALKQGIGWDGEGRVEYAESKT